MIDCFVSILSIWKKKIIDSILFLIILSYFLPSRTFRLAVEFSYLAESSLAERRNCADKNCMEQFIPASIGLGGTILPDLIATSFIMAIYFTPLGIIFCIEEYKTMQLLVWKVKICSPFLDRATFRGDTAQLDLWSRRRKAI